MPDTIKIKGPVIDGDGTVAANLRGCLVVRVVKPGEAVSTKPIKFKTDASGEIKSYKEDGTEQDNLYILRNCTAYIYAPVEGFNRNKERGTAVTIPDADEIFFKDLISIASVPSPGLTLKQDGNTLVTRYGTVDVQAPLLIEETAPGVARLSLDDGPDFILDGGLL